VSIVPPISSVISVEGEDLRDGKNNGVLCLGSGCWLFGESRRPELGDPEIVMLFDTTFVAGVLNISIGGVLGNVAIAGIEPDLHLGRKVDTFCGGDFGAQVDGGDSAMRKAEFGSEANGDGTTKGRSAVWEGSTKFGVETDAGGPAAC